jgi:hypothetical protein
VTTPDAARIDASDIAALTKALSAAGSRAGRDLGPRMRRVGQRGVEQAKRNASWSDRIPGAIYASVSTRGARAGIVLRVRRKQAPHARPYEGLPTKGTRSHRHAFRHPVFARGEDRSEWTWRAQRTRPFLLPAAREQRDAVRTELADLLATVAAQAGFRRAG